MRAGGFADARADAAARARRASARAHEEGDGCRGTRHLRVCIHGGRACDECACDTTLTWRVGGCKGGWREARGEDGIEAGASLALATRYHNGGECNVANSRRKNRAGAWFVFIHTKIWLHASRLACFAIGPLSPPSEAPSRLLRDGAWCSACGYGRTAQGAIDSGAADVTTHAEPRASAIAARTDQRGGNGAESSQRKGMEGAGDGSRTSALLVSSGHEQTARAIGYSGTTRREVAGMGRLSCSRGKGGRIQRCSGEGEADVEDPAPHVRCRDARVGGAEGALDGVSGRDEEAGAKNERGAIGRRVCFASGAGGPNGSVGAACGACRDRWAVRGCSARHGETSRQSGDGAAFGGPAEFHAVPHGPKDSGLQGGEMQKRDGGTSTADTHCTLRLRGCAGDVEGGMLTCETWAACPCVAAELGTDEFEIRVGIAATQRVGSQSPRWRLCATGLRRGGRSAR